MSHIAMKRKGGWWWEWTLILITMICSLAWGCADTPVDDDWSLDNPANFYKITPGLYKISVEIIEDGCTPSLKKIMEQHPQWPSPYTNVSPRTRRVHFGFPEIRSGDYMSSYHLPLEEHGLFKHHEEVFRFPNSNSDYYYILNNNFYGRASNLLEVKRKEFHFAIGPMVFFQEMCDGFSEDMYFMEMRMKGLSENKFEVVYNSNWDNFDKCDVSYARLLSDFFPRHICSESYRIVYEFAYEFDKPCGAEAYNLNEFYCKKTTIDGESRDYMVRYCSQNKDVWAHACYEQVGAKLIE
jgi:hypothetical protein